MATEWEPVVVELCSGRIEDYKAEPDCFEFDCVCMDKDAPDYEDLPYDFTLPTLELQRFTCPRCGRIYKVQAEVKVEVYTPLAIRYPNAPDRMAPETLGLRTKE